MQPLDNNRNIAIIAEALYLANLLILPGVAFLILARLFVKHKDKLSELGKSHLIQTFYISLIGGALIIVIIAALLLAGGFNSAYIWMWVILYFTLIHSTLVVFGALGLAKAMSSKPWQFPIIGRYLPKG